MTRASYNDDDDFYETDEQEYEAPTKPKTRMVDWLQCATFPLTICISAVVLAMFSTELIKNDAFQGASIIKSLIVIASLLLGPMAFISQILGFVFDHPKDKLSYPYYFFRRRVRLSEIDDANCETASSFNLFKFLFLKGNIAGGRSKRYMVNMSGDFGARRVIFRTKYKRDQFLSLLHSYAPQCRITRWV